jgi:hypothetical protein
MFREPGMDLSLRRGVLIGIFREAQGMKADPVDLRTCLYGPGPKTGTEQEKRKDVKKT